jgi:hypothetical protein
MSKANMLQQSISKAATNFKNNLGKQWD